MKKFIYISNIISALPAIIVVPLVPFIFILIEGEGRIPGYLHEYAVRMLMVIYPLSLIACLVGSIKLMRLGVLRPALIVSLLPLLVFFLLFSFFYFGGVVLR
jgi:hypothetical protein